MSVAIAGAVAAVGLLLLLGGVYWYLRRRRLQNDESPGEVVNVRRGSKVKLSTPLDTKVEVPSSDDNAVEEKADTTLVAEDGSANPDGTEQPKAERPKSGLLPNVEWGVVDPTFFAEGEGGRKTNPLYKPSSANLIPDRVSSSALTMPSTSTSTTPLTERRKSVGEMILEIDESDDKEQKKDSDDDDDDDDDGGGDDKAGYLDNDMLVHMRKNKQKKSEEKEEEKKEEEEKEGNAADGNGAQPASPALVKHKCSFTRQETKWNKPEELEAAAKLARAAGAAGAPAAAPAEAEAEPEATGSGHSTPALGSPRMSTNYVELGRGSVDSGTSELVAEVRNNLRRETRDSVIYMVCPLSQDSEYATPQELIRRVSEEVLDAVYLETEGAESLENGGNGQPSAVPGVKRAALAEIEMLGEIDTGVFGAIQSALYRGDGPEKLVTIKSLSIEADEERKTLFLKEASLLSKMDHTNVAKIIALQTETDPLIVVLESMSGGSLNSVLKRQVLSNSTCANYAYQIASGMRYIHSKDIVHGALTSHCIYLNGGTCKVGELGASRRLAPQFLYMWTSPECMEGEAVTLGNDIWGFGSTFFELFHDGSLPYDLSCSQPELKKRLDSGFRLSRPESCSFHQYELIMACWHPNPHLRPDFACIVDRLNELERDSKKLMHRRSSMDMLGNRLSKTYSKGNLLSGVKRSKDNLLSGGGAEAAAPATTASEGEPPMPDWVRSPTQADRERRMSVSSSVMDFELDLGVIDKARRQRLRSRDSTSSIQVVEARNSAVAAKRGSTNSVLSCESARSDGGTPEALLSQQLRTTPDTILEVDGEEGEEGKEDSSAGAGPADKAGNSDACVVNIGEGGSEEEKTQDEEAVTPVTGLRAQPRWQRMSVAEAHRAIATDRRTSGLLLPETLPAHLSVEGEGDDDEEPPPPPPRPSLRNKRLFAVPDSPDTPPAPFPRSSSSGLGDGPTELPKLGVLTRTFSRNASGAASGEASPALGSPLDFGRLTTADSGIVGRDSIAEETEEELEGTSYEETEAALSQDPGEENPYEQPRALQEPAWVHGEMSREEAVDTVMDHRRHGGLKGSYFLRRKGRANTFAITVLNDNFQVSHHLLARKVDGWYLNAGSTKGCASAGASVEEVIRQLGDPKGRFRLPLRVPVSSIIPDRPSKENPYTLGSAN